MRIMDIGAQQMLYVLVFLPQNPTEYFAVYQNTLECIIIFIPWPLIKRNIKLFQGYVKLLLI